MFDMLLQILAIVLLSLDGNYLTYQSMYIAGLAIPIFLDGRNVYKDRWCVASSRVVAEADERRVSKVPFSRTHRPPGAFSWTMFSHLRQLKSQDHLTRDHALLYRSSLDLDRTLYSTRLACSPPRQPPPQQDAVEVQRDDLDVVLEYPVVQSWLKMRGWQQVRFSCILRRDRADDAI